MLLPFVKPDLVRAILNDLYSEVDEDDYEVIMIKAYIVNALNKCNFLRDLLLILPPQTHSLFSKYNDHTLADDPISLTEEEVSEFKEKHKEQAQLFKERLMLNLLTK